ncbi:hypothetical protein ACVWZ3_009333 [Bradyrhizobium sp. i1.3.6]
MPLGRPVEPEEYIQNAISSRWVSASASSAGNCASQPGAAIAAGAAWARASPLTTISVRRQVAAQASASKRVANSASATATAAPESAR